MSGVGSQGSGSRESGVRSQESGVGDQESGIRSQGSGKQKKKRILDRIDRIKRIISQQPEAAD